MSSRHCANSITIKPLNVLVAFFDVFFLIIQNSSLLLEINLSISQLCIFKLLPIST